MDEDAEFQPKKCVVYFIRKKGVDGNGLKKKCKKKKKIRLTLKVLIQVSTRYNKANTIVSKTKQTKVCNSM